MLAQPRIAVLARQADVGDDAASLRVYLVVVLLAVIGVLLVALAIWLFRQTRPDRELLAPLERMNARRWRGLDPQDRRRSLDEVRPDAASPIGRAQREPAVDHDFSTARPVRDFSDLVERDTETTPESPVESHSGGDEDDDGDGHDERDGKTGLSSEAATGTTTGETIAVVSNGNEADDPLVIDTVLADPSVLASTSPIERQGQNTLVNSDKDRASKGSPRRKRGTAQSSADETAPIDRPHGESSSTQEDDTGEHPSEASIDVPLMPGEGLLRRPRTDVDQG